MEPTVRGACRLWIMFVARSRLHCEDDLYN
jgi:hypothetical protein